MNYPRLTLLIFQTSIPSPMKQLTLIKKLASLSRTYKSTTRDWNTLKNTERTDRPSNDFRLFQNWISVKIDSWYRPNLYHTIVKVKNSLMFSLKFSMKTKKNLSHGWVFLWNTRFHGKMANYSKFYTCQKLRKKIFLSGSIKQ